MTSRLTIVTWVWPGERAYGVEHAEALDAMLHAHMSRPYRLVCFAEEPRAPRRDIAPTLEVRPTPIAARRLAELRTPEGHNFPSSYRRLWLFSDAARELGDRVLLVDVDVIVTSDWSHLWNTDSNFVGWQPGQRWGNTEYRMAGGQWLLRTGSLPHVYDDFVRDPRAAIAAARKAGYRGSDQAWISYNLSRRYPVWPTSAGLSSIRDLTRDKRDAVTSAPPRGACVVHFNGKGKPWHNDTKAQHPWISDYWPEGVVASSA